MLLCPKVLRPIVFVNKKIKKFQIFLIPRFLTSKWAKKPNGYTNPPKANRSSTRLSLFWDYGLEPAQSPANFNAGFLIWGESAMNWIYLWKISKNSWVWGFFTCFFGLEGVWFHLKKVLNVQEEVRHTRSSYGGLLFTFRWKKRCIWYQQWHLAIVVAD